MKAYDAPWSKLLRWTSIGATVLLLSIGFALIIAGLIWIMLLIGVIVLGAPLFMVREYEITHDQLEIRRLLWITRIPLDGLKRVTLNPGWGRKCVRTFGNGGLYSFTGLYWHRELGTCRTFVNDLSKCVVLEFEDRKPVVISPDDPEAFMTELENR